MKHLRILGLIVIVLSLVGCNAVKEVSESINYVTEAMDYGKEVTAFISQAPGLVTVAVNSEEKTRELKNVLEEMKLDIEEFNELTPISSLEETHNKVVGANEQLLVIIDKTLPHVQEGTLSKELADEILNQINNNEQVQAIKTFLDEIKNFGK